VIMSQFPGNPELRVPRGGASRAPFKAPPPPRVAPPSRLPNRPGESISPRPVEPVQDGGVPRYAAGPPRGDQALAPADAPLRPTVERMSEPNVGSSHIADFRAHIGVPTTQTVAVGRTNVPGLEGISFEGASPHVWKEAGLPPPPPGKYESPSAL